MDELKCCCVRTLYMCQACDVRDQFLSSGPKTHGGELLISCGSYLLMMFQLFAVARLRWRCNALRRAGMRV